MGMMTEENTKLLKDSSEYPGEKLSFVEDGQFKMELNELLERKGVKVSQLVENCWPSKASIHNYLNYSNPAMPSRSALLDICVEVGASREETDRLLRLAAMAKLDACSKQESVIMWGMENGKTVREIRDELYDRGLELNNEKEK